MVFLVLIAVFVVLVASLILYARWNFGVLEAMGIPVVKPHFILGSTYDVHKKVGTAEDIARFTQLGPVYGVYEGRQPQVHICDPEILKCILVKDFDHFNARREIDFGSPLLNEMPDFFPDAAKWKFVRQMTTATLTPAKIKGMSGSMKESMEDYIEDLKNDLKKNGNKPLNIDIRQSIFTMLTDMITRCVFSIKIDNKSDSNNHFVQIVKRIISGEGENVGTPNFMIPLSMSFPFLKKFSPKLFDPAAGDDFVRVFKEILANRKRSGRHEKDYTETVLQWMEKLDSPEYKKHNVHELTLMMQALVIFFAGQDQISTIITNLFLEASKNPEIEQRILEELNRFLVKHNGKIEYENLSELTYLNACIHESLRLVPFFIRLERVCTKDWEYESGLKIKKGTVVIVPIWAVNRHPDYFPKPETFNPDRFLPENKANLNPYAFTSFGLGPRNCIGMRFALDVLLFLGAHVYRDFHFRPNEDSKIKFLPGSLFMGYCEPIRLDLIKRDWKEFSRSA